MRPPTAHPRRAPAAARPRRARGAWSLVELAMCLAIMALVTGMALPRYARSLARYRADAAAKRVAADLALARLTARTTNTSQQVDFTTPAGLVVGYTLTNTNDPDRPGQTYVVDLGNTPYNATAVAATLTPAGGGSAVSKVTFDRYGAAGAGGTIRVTAGDVSRTVSLDVNTGRATVQ